MRVKAPMVRVFPDRGFGFVSRPGTTDLFFHVKGKKTPRIIGMSIAWLNYRGDESIHLQEGSFIYYEYGVDPHNREEARYWVFAEEQERLQQQLESLPHYRLQYDSVSARVVFSSAPKPHTMWQGVNVKDDPSLRRVCPSQTLPPGKWFERLEGGTWVRVPDPRV